jgi:recombination protein RecA
MGPAVARKLALEDLLRARKLQADAPPLRGETRLRRLPTGVPALDAWLGGGFPRGQASEVIGPASSGRTGLVLAAIARVTAAGTLAAWVDPADRLDPASVAAAGGELQRLLWVRGDERGDPRRGLADATAAVFTLVGSGLFDLVVLDLAAAADHDLRRLPAATWIRLNRALEPTTTALVLLASGHVAKSPGGAAVTLAAGAARFAGAGPGRLLLALGASVRSPWAEAGPALELRAFRAPTA